MIKLIIEISEMLAEINQQIQNKKRINNTQKLLLKSGRNNGTTEK